MVRTIRLRARSGNGGLSRPFPGQAPGGPPSRSFAVLALALGFSAIMLLIADLDRPQEGLLKVSQQAMIDLQRTLSAPGQ